MNQIAVIPQPTSIEPATGFFTLTADCVIVADAASKETAAQLASILAPATGFALKLSNKAPSTGTTITLSQNETLTHLGAEGYDLVVAPEAITLSAKTQTGLFYAVQTLRQLFPTELFSPSLAQSVAWQAPCLKITDIPRFGWRGLMLDTGHDFQELSFIFRFIDLMAIHKFNIFHWHITDLGTWPLEIKGYPELLNPETRGTRMRGYPQRGVKPGHYTQDEVRQVVQYAAKHHITVLPEIDMPGHVPPVLLAYPELDCPVPFVHKEFKAWEYCVGNEKTYQFLQDVLAQVIDLFPSKYIHIGGDECPKEHWRACPICQAKMKAEHLANEDELQSYFIKRIGSFLNSKGRRLIGWDEILEGGIAPDATVMSWRGIEGGITAAQAGHDVVMAASSHLYFDYTEETTPLEKVYSFEPVPSALTPAQSQHILGAQSQMWSDNHPTTGEIESLVYPRACATSEIVWSPTQSREFAEFIERLTVHTRRLAALNVNYHPLPTPSEK